MTKPTTKQPNAAIKVNAGAMVIHRGGALWLDAREAEAVGAVLDRRFDDAGAVAPGDVGDADDDRTT